MSSIFGNSIAMSNKALDYLWKKQEVTADNIANVDTPYYKKKHISFEDTFRKKLEAASLEQDSVSMKNAIALSDYRIWERNDTTRIDENNVNYDVESAELARTTLHYQSVLNAVNSDFARLRAAIKGQ